MYFHILGQLARDQLQLVDAYQCFVAAKQLSSNDPFHTAMLGRVACEYGFHDYGIKMFKQSLLSGNLKAIDNAESLLFHYLHRTVQCQEQGQYCEGSTFLNHAFVLGFNVLGKHHRSTKILTGIMNQGATTY